MGRPRGRGLQGDRLVLRAAEAFERSESAGCLGSALTQMARDLAEARRRIAALQRENAALQQQLTTLTPARLHRARAGRPGEGPDGRALSGH